MLQLPLINIINIVQANSIINQNPLIKNVTNDITKLGNDTVVFHLNKDVEMNMKEVIKYKNLFIITDQPVLNDESIESDKFIYVLDINKAYFRFINYYRSLFNIPVVAITGTCGKTTTKEIIRQILENEFKVASTISNKNNLGFNHDYLLSINNETSCGVFETALSYPGNLITGCDFFKPTIGIITNIGIDHLNGCKTINNYIRAKGEMLAGLQYKGTLIINNDDENIKKINLSAFKGKIVTFGINNPSDIFARNIDYKDDGMEFHINFKDVNYQVYMPGLGIHNVYNAIAAISALIVLGFDINKIVKYIRNIKHIRSHVEFHKGYNNSTIIDDTWSSNPTSFKAAMEVLTKKGEGKVKIVILGKINYLGDYAQSQYEEIGKIIVDNKVDFVITTDSYSKQIGISAISNGLMPDYHIHCKDNKELKHTLECLLDKNTIALFKTSMLEQSITGIIKEFIVEDINQ